MDTQVKKVNNPKVLNSNYLVKVNGEVVNSEPIESIKMARDFVRNLQITDSVKTVNIVRQTLTETLVSTFEPKATISLISVDALGLE